MYREVNATLRLLIKVQWLFIAVLSAVALGLWIGWKSAPRDITLHLPPDLRNGAHLKIGEIPLSNVYTFAYYIFQQLNSWPQSGTENYGANIWRLSAYFTDGFQQTLLRDLDERGRRGELAYRKRGLFESPGAAYEDWRVEVLSDDSWIVLLDLEIEETVRGVTVKNPVLRYPLKVFRSRADPERNPYGMVLAGFAGDGPRRVEPGAPQAKDGHG